MAPPRVRYSEGELNQMLARHFPLERRVLEVIELSLANPQLTLKPEAGRLATHFDLQASERLTGQRWHGEVALDQFLFMRPLPSCARYATPLTGFFLCGTGSHPGHATGAAALLATQQLA